MEIRAADIMDADGILNIYEYLIRNSAQFHAHMGFQPVGEFHRCGYKFHKWYGMIWMEKIIGQHESEQAEVVPYPNMQHERMWQ